MHINNCLLSVFLGLAVLSYAYCQTAVGSLPGKCPKNFKYITNINQDRLQGIYYGQYATSNGSAVGCSGECLAAYVIRQKTNVLGVHQCCQRRDKPFCGAEVPSFDIDFSARCLGHLKFQYAFGNAPGYYLKIDYGKYIIAFSCATRDDGSADLSAFAYTMTPKAPKNFKQLVRDTLRKNGINPNVLVHIPQNSQCNYLYKP